MPSKTKYPSGAQRRKAADENARARDRADEAVDLDEDDWLAIEREACSRSLATYIQQAWRVVEPAQRYIHGWHIDAMAEHLEAVSRGEINRLYIAVPPGCMKSLTVDVFWPTWEWGPRNMPHLRILATSHSERLAIRDNVKARRLIDSQWYRKLWGGHVKLTSDQNEKRKFENTRTGFREAMPFQSLTGSRGDRVLIDDPLSVDDALSEAKRESVNTTFLEAIPTRVNDPIRSAIVAIQQRLHVRDVIGIIEAKNLGYESLVLPMEYEKDRILVSTIGFKDPRTEEGELLFPERFPREVVDRDKKIMGSHAAAGQFQQRPTPREGGMFKRPWFEIVPAAPSDVDWVRGWDLAATEAGTKVNPAYSAGVKVGRCRSSGVFYIAHAIRGQLSSARVEEMMVTMAGIDGKNTTVDIPQDPGQAGKSQVRYLVSALAGYVVKFSPESGSKEQRAMPMASQAEAGNVKMVKGDWNEDFLAEAETFPNGNFKDQIDAASRAFNRLVPVGEDDDIPASPEVIRGDGNAIQVAAPVDLDEFRTIH